MALRARLRFNFGNGFLQYVPHIGEAALLQVDVPDAPIHLGRSNLHFPRSSYHSAAYCHLKAEERHLWQLYPTCLKSLDRRHGLGYVNAQLGILLDGILDGVQGLARRVHILHGAISVPQNPHHLLKAGLPDLGGKVLKVGALLCGNRNSAQPGFRVLT